MGSSCAKKARRKSAESREDTLSTLKLEKAIKKRPPSSRAACSSALPSPAPWCSTATFCCSTSPFSALDAVVKVDLSEELKELQSELGITMMMVTHDQEEAFSLSDRIILMDHGHIVADAPPIDLYETQGNAFTKPSSSTKSTSAHAISGI